MKLEKDIYDDGGRPFTQWHDETLWLVFDGDVHPEVETRWRADGGRHDLQVFDWDPHADHGGVPGLDEHGRLRTRS